MRVTQTRLHEFYDLPCAMIVNVDGVVREPPIQLTKDELESFIWRGGGEWERIVFHFLDHRGEPKTGGQFVVNRDDLIESNHFLL